MEGSQRSSAKKNWLGIFLLTALIYIISCVFFWLLTARPGHDQSWYIIAAERFLAGAKLYGPQIAETNPPLIIWFSALSVLIAHSAHIASMLAFRLLVLAIIFGCAGWSARLLHRDNPDNSYSLLVTLCLIVLFDCGIGAYDFGQREQLMVVLSLPYILAVATGVTDRLSFAENCGLGIAAGVGICFKPQQVLVMVFLELFLALKTRSLRRGLSPTFLAVLFTGAFYLLLVRLTAPLYFSDAVPLIINTYWAYGRHTLLQLMLVRWKTLLVILFGSLACIRLRRSIRLSLIPAALLICSFASVLAFCIQHTGFIYQAYPSNAFAALAILFLLMELLKPLVSRLKRDSPSIFRGSVVVLTLIAVVFGTLALTRKIHNDRPTPNELELDHFLAQNARQTPVYIFSTNVTALSDVFEDNLVWGSRFPAIWMLPAIVQNELGPLNTSVPFKRLNSKTLAKLAELQRTDTIEDLNHWKPAVILVDHCSVEQPCQALEGRNFDIIAWFMRSPDFVEAWSHYKRQQGSASYDVYKLVDNASAQ
jgi:hypothetical protein